VWVTFDPTDVEDNPTGVIHGHTVTNPLYLYATSVNTRLDTEEAHDFLAPYLP
jgi:hypothetical protein